MFVLGPLWGQQPPRPSLSGWPVWPGSGRRLSISRITWIVGAGESGTPKPLRETLKEGSQLIWGERSSAQLREWGTIASISYLLYWFVLHYIPGTRHLFLSFSNFYALLYMMGTLCANLIFSRVRRIDINLFLPFSTVLSFMFSVLTVSTSSVLLHLHGSSGFQRSSWVQFAVSEPHQALWRHPQQLLAFPPQRAGLQAHRTSAASTTQATISSQFWVSTPRTPPSGFDKSNLLLLSSPIRVAASCSHYLRINFFVVFFFFYPFSHLVSWICSSLPW